MGGREDPCMAILCQARTTRTDARKAMTQANERFSDVALLHNFLSMQLTNLLNEKVRIWSA